jgi:hypothetical protein
MAKQIFGFKEDFEKVLNMNPVADFAQKLVLRGYTEEDVSESVKSFPDPDRMRLISLVRDFSRTTTRKSK